MTLEENNSRYKKNSILPPYLLKGTCFKSEEVIGGDAASPIVVNIGAIND